MNEPRTSRTTSHRHASAAAGDRSRWLALAVVLAGTFVILLDATIVNVAIPSIQQSLRASYGAIEWVVSGYALAYGLLLVPAGRLADRYGHKRLFLIGLAGFTLASALCGTARTPAQLVGWRVLQGVMAGLLNPPILAVIQLAFPPRERGKAFAWYGAVAGVSTAAGPLLGGLLISWNLHGWDWRPIFLLNVPIGVLALVAAGRLLPSSRGRGGDLDPVGVALVSAAMLLLTYPLVEGRDAGWPAWTFVSLALAVPVLGACAAWEVARVRRGRAPLVDVRLFANRSFTAGVGIGLAYFAGFISLLFVLSLHLQIGLGRSALAAGLTLLPFALGTFAGAAVSDPLAHRLGRRVLHLGTAIAMAGIAGLIVAVHRDGGAISGLDLLPWLALCGIGSGLVLAPNVEIVLAGVPRHDAGAGGVLNTAQRLGQALGIAVVGVVLFGALGSGAGHAAATATPALRRDLAAAGMPAGAADRGVSQFSQCFERRARGADPTANPPGCPRPAAGDPTGQAFARAAGTALADNFSHAVQLAAAGAFGAVLLTFLLVFVLRRERSTPPAGEWAPSGPGGA
jgi:EmrB/QacA subfamily drug resistance transporter